MIESVSGTMRISPENSRWFEHRCSIRLFFQDDVLRDCLNELPLSASCASDLGPSASTSSFDPSVSDSSWYSVSQELTAKNSVLCRTFPGYVSQSQSIVFQTYGTAHFPNSSDAYFVNSKRPIYKEQSRNSLLSVSGFRRFLSSIEK